MNILVAVKNAFVRNWQTTGSALVASIAGLVATQPDLFGVSATSTLHSVAVWVAAGGLAALGITAKQHNVTGGTVEAAPPPKENA